MDTQKSTKRAVGGKTALPAPIAEPTTFADWLYARGDTVRHYRQPPTITDGERAAWEFWCGKQAERIARNR